MYPYPTATLTAGDVAYTTATQVICAIIFDLITLYVAERYLKLPILKTWSAMWEKKYKFFGFLLFGLLTMGLLGVCFVSTRVIFANSIPLGVLYELSCSKDNILFFRKCLFLRMAEMDAREL